MKKNFSIIFLFAILILTGVAIFSKSSNDAGQVNFAEEIEESIDAADKQKENENEIKDKDDEFALPIENASERITKKSFGTFVTPQNSPVSPERFYGYHTALDFEIFLGEEEKEIEIKAICTGEILSKRSASGYGGVAVQACQLENKPITVIYGHLDLDSMNKGIGGHWNKGEVIGILGKGYTSETDNERKHLHLGIRKGETINILGYVQNKSDLEGWIDPCLYICKK